ncbi:c-type cytochrome [Granulosicoccus antarcticus]|uniref:Cytochrome c4 n=1 Tax=Granulosicoccus antarcticus IMCC3135 TaxID=1192854 RepID=A0A2Z2NRU8_9GAMM|nr:c-type cytochrome [Granulosicoccus antarcticus]ASJ70267.1 Cytochrome c4 [Granulosicoccus antarcticus IMCC3135]
MKIWALAAALAFAWLASPASAAGDPATGKEKSAVCSACHGADGKAIMPAYPNLAGQHASYISKQLTAYRDGDRVNALMSGQATNLTDEDIEDLAAYYASMTKHEGVASEEDDLALGRDIYRGGITAAGVAACSACHGPAGEGNPGASWPVVSGQNAEYAADQLKYFRSGERANDPNSMMRGIAKRMTDAEITAVTNYITGLHAAP